MAGQTRELTVDYGGFALGAANGCYIQGDREQYRLVRSYPEGSFTCEFIVLVASPTGTTATDNATFATLCTDVETALRKPNQRLQVKLGASTLADINPSSSARTGFNIRGAVEKVGSGDDSGRTRRYRFTCTFKLRSDLSGRNNRTTESTTETVSTITGRRTVVATAGWKGSSNTTALAEYTTNGDTYFATILPTPVASGEWLKVDENPQYDDENAELVVTRTYWEVVNGLREVDVSVERGPSRIRRVTISGMYTKTASNTAKVNHDNNVATLVSNVMTAVGVTSYNSVATLQTESYGTTEEQYFFRRVLDEIVYAQSTSTDDTHVVSYSLTVGSRTPFTPRAITSSIRPEQIKTYTAFYEADIDKDQSTDLKNLWETKYRAHAVNAVQTKLNATNVALEEEDYSSDLTGNRIVAKLTLTARGSDVLSLELSERIQRTTSVNPRPRADGTPHSYFLFRSPPQKLLLRTARIEYVAGSQTPEVFKPGDTASGLDLVNTGQTVFQALDNLERGVLPNFPGWLALAGDAVKTPLTRGQNEEFSTIVLVQSESWLFVEKLEQAPNAVTS